jgi:hypothetical protein
MLRLHVGWSLFVAFYGSLVTSDWVGAALEGSPCKYISPLVIRDWGLDQCSEQNMDVSVDSSKLLHFIIISASYLVKAESISTCQTISSC